VILKQGSLLAGVVLMTCAVPSARGEVMSASAGGFSVKSSVEVPVAPARAYEALVRDVGAWWDSAHTFWEDAGNLSIDARPGGCFCERASGGRAARHGVVVYVDPGKELRINGAMGPMQTMGVTGVLSFVIRPAGTGSKIELLYNAGGFVPDGLDKLAPVVDRVWVEQLARLKHYLH